MAMKAEKYTDYMYNLIDRVMKEIGPRGSCSAEEKRCGRLFAEEISPACESVEFETFTCSPDAFLGFFPYLVLMFAAGVVLYFFFPPASAALALAGILVVFLEVVRYKELIDPLFPKREGENVLGIIKPTGEPSKRVYVSAHFDSAYEFKLWYWMKGFSTVYMAAGVIAILALFGFGIARSFVKPIGLPSTAAWWTLGFVLVGLTPLVSIFALFHTRDLVPGAMDDMAGVAVLAGLSKYFSDARGSGDFYPASTEVVLLGLSSEEAGLRGAKRFASRHAAESRDMDTMGVFLDGIYDESYFTIFKRELWPGGRMDPRLVKVSGESAKACGVEPRIGILPLGATDASAFALEGIPSVGISLWDTTRLVPHYHTRYDTIDHIRPVSLAVALQAVINILTRLDEP